MAERKKDVLREHSFDGIEEYDNQLPLWWTALFIITIIFAVLYVGYFHFGPGKVGTEKYHAEEKRLLEEQLASGKGPPTEPMLRGLLGDQERIAAGRALYIGAGGCVACHLDSGLGAVGPNLRDDLWKYGSDLLDIYESIAEGRNNNAMPYKQGILPRDDIINLALYVAHRNKTEKANGQGVVMPGEVEDPITY